MSESSISGMKQQVTAGGTEKESSSSLFSSISSEAERETELTVREAAASANEGVFRTNDALPTSNTSLPSMVKVNSALILVQVIFGLGSIVAALGLPTCNPFAFALYREATAGVLLLLCACVLSRRNKENTTLTDSDHNSEHDGDDSSHHHHRHGAFLTLWTPLQQNLPRFLLTGCMIYANQAGSITGVKLAGGIAAAVWQPSQPIMTAAICMALGWESLNPWRVIGVIVAFGGCVGMVLLHNDPNDDKDGGSENSSSPLSFLVGNVLFFINCLGTSLYVILSKKLLRLYPPIVVTAWSYNIASFFMAVTALLASASKDFMTFICPDCTEAWYYIPPGALFALLYFILFNSCIAYGTMTWANQYATGTLIMGYTVLQPVTAALVTVLLLVLGTVPSCSGNTTTPGDGACLDPPTFGTLLGMTGVVAGLVMVIATEPSKEEQQQQQQEITSNATEAAYDPVARNDNDDNDNAMGGEAEMSLTQETATSSRNRRRREHENLSN